MPPVSASHTDRRSASQRSLAAPRARRDTAPPAWEHATRYPAPIVWARGRDPWNQQRDLQTGEAEARDEARRQRRDPQHSKGTGSLGAGEDRQEEPARG